MTEGDKPGLLDRIYGFRYRGPLAIAALALFLVFFGFLYPRVTRTYQTPGETPFRLQLAWSAADFKQVIADWSVNNPRAPEIYKNDNLIRLDFFFPLIYAVMFAFAYSWARGEKKPVRRLDYVLFLLPFCAALFDYIENILHLSLLSGIDTAVQAADHSFPDGVVHLATIASRIKLALFAVAFFAWPGAWIVRLRRSVPDGTPAVPFLKIADDERAEIQEQRKELHLKIADDCFIGLAFSGGGIRSATFNLGVLQGLAEKRLLRYVDYLSTVSGGGYIGAWLLARMKQNNKTITQIENELSPKCSPDVHSNEWAPIQFLRDYSNYLTPQTGFLSADTWIIASIWLRNTLLTQSVLILALSALLLAPRWVSFVTELFAAPSTTIFAFAAACFFLAVAGCIFGLFDFGSRGTRNQTLVQNEVLLIVVAPLFLLCWFAAAVSMRHPSPAWTGWQPNDSMVLVLSTGIVIFVGLLIIQFGAGFGDSVKQIFFSMLAGASASVLTFGAMKLSARLFVDPGAKQVLDFAMIAGPLLSIAALSAVITLYIGLMGRDLKDGQREWLSRVGTWLNIFGVAWLALFGVAIYAPPLVKFGFSAAYSVWPKVTTGAAVSTILGWLVSTIGGLAASWSPETGSAAKPRNSGVLKILATYAPYVFVAGLLILLSLGVDFVVVLAPASGRRYYLLGTIVLAAVAYLLSRRFDLNEFSMHHFYKNRLVRCYLGGARQGNRENPRSADRFTGFDPADDILLKAVAQRPYPLINTTLNLVHGERLSWQERRATSFVMTPKYCGYDYVPGPSNAKKTLSEQAAKVAKAQEHLERNGYRPTATYAGGINLGAAMAISGAAVNPNMGSFGSAATAFLMTVFNIRLGWWLGNPRHTSKWKEASPKAGIFYLFNELTGSAGDNSSFVNLSDGGHFENLGIYELVRRRCTYIIASDASQDREFTFEDLGSAIRKCRADFGVEIDIDLSELRPAEDGHSRAHCAVGSINYPPQAPGGEGIRGILVYIKTSLTGDEPSDLLEYSKLHQEFPHQSTADQWFDESQFESYRCLGYHIAGKIFNRSVHKMPPHATVGELFEDLENAWFPPSAAVQKSFTKHGEAFDRLLERMRTSKDLDPLVEELYEHLDGANHQRFLYCNSLLQLMENVYIDLCLEESGNHPDNEGWMRVFRWWWRSDTLQNAWLISKPTFGKRFGEWCERELVKER